MPPTHRLRALGLVAVVALIAVGAAFATRSASFAAPSNQSKPAISGNPQVGSTLTATPGTWNGSAPIGFQFQWQICGQHGNNCHPIPGATSNTYTVRAGDAGNTIRVHVIASNGEGSSGATSNPTRKIGGGTPAGAPNNRSLPSISGTATVGGTLTADPGTWSGASPMSFQYQWQVCGGNGNNCHPIAGATSNTYAVQSGDAGNTIRVHVIASNANGSSGATSGPTAKVAATAPAPAPAPAATGCPKTNAGATSVAVSSITAPARLQIAGFSASGPITSGTMSFAVRFHVADTCGQAVAGAQVYATAVPYRQFSIPSQAVTDQNGDVTLTFNRQGGFPAAKNQTLLVMFVRASKPGDPVLAGISTRRLVSLRVNLHA